MTTDHYLSPLDRLKLEAATAASNPSEWLSSHKDDVVAVWKEKGTTTLAAILGLSNNTLRGWARRRKLDGLWHPRARAKAKRQAGRPAPEAQPPVRRTKPVGPDSGYWRGQAEAYKHALELLCGVLQGKNGGSP